MHLDWKFKEKNELSWPDDESGEAVPPAFLTHIVGGPLDMEVTLSLLEAYGIPHVCEYPNNGLFGKLILGHPPGGMEVYVPETMLEDAQNLLCADIVDEENEIEAENAENFEEETE